MPFFKKLHEQALCTIPCRKKIKTASLCAMKNQKLQDIKQTNKKIDYTEIWEK